MITLPECSKCGPVIEVKFSFEITAHAWQSTDLTRYGGTLRFRVGRIDRVPGTSLITGIQAVGICCPWCTEPIDLKKYGWAIKSDDEGYELVPAVQLMEESL